MAQRRFWNWKDDDYTLDMNHALLGILEAGLYRGFDKHSSSTGTNLVLHHGVNGVQKSKLDKSLTSLMGVYLTKQGCIITEDANVTIGSITPNTTGNPRKDLIVATHEYQQTVGGLVAIYTAIVGTPSATPVVPALTNPTTQTILGVLDVPANTSSTANMTFTKSGMPNLGNAPAIALSLNDLTDVTITNATDKDILVKNGTGDWVNMNAKNFIQTLQLNMTQRFGLSYSQQLLAYMSGGSPVMGFVDDIVAVTGGYAFDFGANVIHWDVGDGVFSSFQVPNLWGASAVKWGADHPSGTVIYMIINPNIGMNIQFGATGAPTGYAPFVSNTKTGTVGFGATCLKFTKYTHKLSSLFAYQNFWLVEEIKDYDAYIQSLQTQINTLTTNLNLLDLTMQQEFANTNQNIGDLQNFRAMRDSSNLSANDILLWRRKLKTNAYQVVCSASVDIDDSLLPSNWNRVKITFPFQLPGDPYGYHVHFDIRHVWFGATGTPTGGSLRHSFQCHLEQNSIQAENRLAMWVWIYDPANMNTNVWGAKLNLQYTCIYKHQIYLPQ